ncbi:hypothetical protein GQ457_05G008940 [Hibiscus cannabinus]
MSTSTTTQHLLQNFHPRKFLQHSSLYPTESPMIPPVQHNFDRHLDADVIFVLSVLVCSLITSLGLFYIVQCAIRCSTLVAANTSAESAKSGVEKNALKAFPTVKYTPELKLPGLDSACVVCLSEFAAGERLRILPRCNHGFHARCIDKWLSSHSSCPTCRHCLTETDQRRVGDCGRDESSEQPVPVQESV